MNSNNNDGRLGCCLSCFEHMYKIDPDAAYFWCDAVNCGFEYLLGEPDSMLKLLEINGYIVTTEFDFKLVSIKILGIDYYNKIACIKNCFMDK